MMAWKVTHRFLWGFVAGIVLLAVGPVGYAMDPAIPEIVKEQNFDFSDIVFAVRQPGYDWGGKPGHYYANFGRFAYDDDPLQQPGYENRWAYGEGGRLCRLNLKTGGITVLLEDERGAIRDPQMHYDGKKVLFSYRPAGDHFYHLYEIGIDGIGLRQLTDGDYNDIEASYLPDGGIVFVSSRGNRWVNCWLTEVAILYRCDGDGKNIRALSSNNEHDNTPSVLPDGRILYTRWEYVDRSQVHYHHLWTINPDGTAQSVYYGNLNPGVVMIDSKPIPGTRVIASIFSPGHGRSEHQGAVTIVDPRMGPDEKTNVEKITKKENFRDVYPISDRWFLAAQERRIVLMNREGKTWTVYELDREDRAHDLLCHEPAALRGRPRETLLQSRVDLAQETGEVVLANAYLGRNMQGVKPGDIKKILVL